MSQGTQAIMGYRLSMKHYDLTVVRFFQRKQVQIYNTKDASGKAKPKHFMPFGGGIRQCPGAELAKLEIIVFTHHLILNYNWKLVSSECLLTVPHVDFFKGLPLKVQELSLE
uniref:Cytochrome P450 90B2 n=1 Tax=Elaeis guineensis var. tenera TaxID=51953 RepID=A0A8N4I7M3_ELAGV|nr:cytochrome P450 90B2 [Elaeis guineensis]